MNAALREPGNNLPLPKLPAGAPLEKQAVETLQASELLFAGAFEHAPIGVALVSLTGSWLKVNRALCELVGYSEGELLTRTFQDITHPDDLEPDLGNMRRVLAGEIATYRMEKRYIHARGHHVIVRLSVSLVRDEDARPLYFISQLEDITEQKHAEAKRRAEEERYVAQRNALISFTGGGTLRGDDLTDTLRRLTETAAKTLGSARVSIWRYNEDRTAIRCVDLYELEADRHSAGVELAASAYPAYFRALLGLDVIAADDAHQDTRTSEFSDGYLRPLGITSMLDAPIHLNGAGEGVLCHEHIGPARQWTGDEETFAVAVANLVSLALEGAERKRAEESLRLLSSAVSQAKEAIMITDAELDLPGPRIVFVNPAYTQMTGYTAEDVIGKTPRITQGPRTDRAVLQRLRENLTRGEVFQGETVNYRKDGIEFHLEWQIAPLRNAAGTITHFVAIQRDITKRKVAEQALEQAHRQLQDASRRAGMAEIATNVLHNVGNVLNSVNISCSVIEDKVRKSRIGSVAKTAELLLRHTGNMAAFFDTDPAGQKLPEYLGKLAGRLAEEQAAISAELHSLSGNIDHIKDIVTMQQNHARVSGVTEISDIADLIEISLRMSGDALNLHKIEVMREYGEVPPAAVEKAKVLQILVNLISNAKSACDESICVDKQITLRLTVDGETVRIAVIDNGVGISPENLIRIFAHGFTTKSDGHGFGLHGSVLAAREMGGDLTVHSDGSGKGATFTLILPISPMQAS